MYSNPNGMLLKVSVSDACSGCGACSAFGDCFVDTPNGKAAPAHGGYFPKNALSALQEAEDVCPEGAISHSCCSIVKSSGSVSVSDLKNFIQKELINYVYPRPKYKDYDWKKYIPDVDGTGLHSWSRYDYSSFEGAKRAGVNELQRVIFDHLDTYVSRALIEYKHHRLTPLITYEEKESNFYYHEKVRMEAILEGFLSEAESVIGKQIPNKQQLASLSVTPDFGYNGKNFEALTKLEDRTGIAMGDLHDASYYDTWIDEDSTEEYAGRGFFGEKYVTKWAYNAREALQEIQDDLNSGAKEGMRDHFEHAIESNYQFGGLVKPMEEEIKNRGAQLLALLNKFVTNNIDDHKPNPAAKAEECTEEATSIVARISKANLSLSKELNEVFKQAIDKEEDNRTSSEKSETEKKIWEKYENPTIKALLRS